MSLFIPAYPNLLYETHTSNSPDFENKGQETTQTKNTPVFLLCEVCPMLGRRSTSVLSMKTKAAPQQISKGHLSPSQKHCEVEKLDLHPKTQRREKTLPKYCTHEKAVSKPSLGM